MPNCEKVVFHKKISLTNVYRDKTHANNSPILKNEQKL